MGRRPFSSTESLRLCSTLSAATPAPGDLTSSSVFHRHLHPQCKETHADAQTDTQRNGTVCRLMLLHVQTVTFDAQSFTTMITVGRPTRQEASLLQPVQFSVKGSQVWCLTPLVLVFSDAGTLSSSGPAWQGKLQTRKLQSRTLPVSKEKQQQKDPTKSM